MAARPKPSPTLIGILGKLRAYHGHPAPLPVTDPFEMILWENIAYLVPDTRRAQAFEALRERVGTKPADILRAKHDVLDDIAKMGGPRPEDRVEKLRAIAHVAESEFAGDLNTVLEQPTAIAKRGLQRFPGIGVPGAEHILMANGVLKQLALESNGLRVLVRIGFGDEKKNYAATYRSVQEGIAPQLPSTRAALVEAHTLLRMHGQTVCKTAHPRCDECPVVPECKHAQSAL